MKILSICRGAPGLGRVVPSLGLSQTMARTRDAETTFASYAAGYAYLAATGHDVTDTGCPNGLFIDSVAPEALRLLDLVHARGPDLIIIDGEFFLPATFAHLDIPVVYLANPHDLIGPANTFRRVNQLLLGHADAVIVSSLNCSQPATLPLVPGVTCLHVPPIIKEFPVGHRPSTTRRLLISMGGGSIRADPAFGQATDEALAVALDAASALVEAGGLDAVTVVLGADGTLPAGTPPAWMTVHEGPVELTSLYADHEVFLARAGRNATAEALYCGIPTVLLPVTADRHRGSEQAANADAVTAAHMFPVPDWRTPGALLHAIGTAAATGARRRTAGPRGNDAAAEFLAGVVARVDDPRALLPNSQKDHLHDEMGHHLPWPARHRTGQSG